MKHALGLCAIIAMAMTSCASIDTLQGGAIPPGDSVGRVYSYVDPFIAIFKSRPKTPPALNDIVVRGKIIVDNLYGKITLFGNVSRRFSWDGSIVTNNKSYSVRISSIVNDLADNSRYYGRITFRLSNGGTIDQFDIGEIHTIDTLPYKLIAYTRDGKTKCVHMTASPYLFTIKGQKLLYYSGDLINYHNQRYTITDDVGRLLGELNNNYYSMASSLSPEDEEDTKLLVGCIVSLRSMITELTKHFPPDLPAPTR